MTASRSVEGPLLASTGRIANEFCRYFGCSLVALVTDFALFTLSLWLGWTYPWGAAAGFGVGLWVAYTLTSRFAFSVRTIADKGHEFVVFALIGFLGLLLTEMLLWLLIQHHGTTPQIAKMASTPVVFCFNFVTRKYFLFTVSKGSTAI